MGIAITKKNVYSKNVEKQKKIKQKYNNMPMRDKTEAKERGSGLWRIGKKFL